jgi:SAM-dependent methyltransferase
MARAYPRVALVLGLAIAAAVFFAQWTKGVTPRPGQPGKDVLWLPTQQALLDGMLDLAQVTPQDTLLDLGSGDGRVVIAAAKRGAQGIGIEFNPDLVDFSRRSAAAQGVSARTAFITGDLFEADLSKATVITMFLRQDLNLKLRPKLLGLKPGTRVVSNTFTMGDWEPDDIITLRECASLCSAMLWTVPARVAGNWQLPEGHMTLAQTFQEVTGTIQSRTGSAPVTSGRMHVDQITFSAGHAQYRGRVSESVIEGTVTSNGATAKWTAVREEHASLAGTWNVHIVHMSGRIVNEQWIVEQHDDRVKGLVKTARRDFPLEGTVNGNRIEVKVTTAEDRYNLFRGTIDDDALKGTIEQKGDDGTFSATRSAPDPK